MPILLILLLFSSIAGGGYFYYTDTQATIGQLRENNVQLKIAVNDNQKTIDSLNANVERNQELSEELQSALNKSEESRNRLIEVFGKHDLVRLALRKPGLIEKRINNGTKKAFDEIEFVSGNPPTDDGL